MKKSTQNVSKEDLISRKAAIDAVNGVIADYIPTLYGRYEALPLEMATALKRLPSVEPTLYGYKIEHLAYIARVMQKEGVTAEYAVRTFGDISRASRMIIEELQERVEKSLSAMQLPSAQPEKRTEERTKTHACDSISRRAAIEVMTSSVILVTNNNVDAVKKVMELFIDKIKNLPSAIEPEPQWIPCSERLPEKEGWYLISVKTGNVTKAFYRVAPIKQGGCYWRGHITKPTAWMELPEPWEGGTE